MAHVRTVPPAPLLCRDWLRARHWRPGHAPICLSSSNLEVYRISPFPHVDQVASPALRLPLAPLLLLASRRQCDSAQEQRCLLRVSVIASAGNLQATTFCSTQAQKHPAAAQSGARRGPRRYAAAAVAVSGGPVPDPELWKRESSRPSEHGDHPPSKVVAVPIRSLLRASIPLTSGHEAPTRVWGLLVRTTDGTCPQGKHTPASLDGMKKKSVLVDRADWSSSSTLGLMFELLVRSGRQPPHHDYTLTWTVLQGSHTTTT
ncbi:uncharacterized protein B0I36DRAFT_428365 [Microdochium trichocladiopsis]|uniref:Uncharacterized protein n=1 Tax=Microdochium trichocladiopsis TaxID=1682393 RepID=A0A9P8YH18_9PEZI|nr:uncharacterized protein B0I36DRAFT_428365 [Microdochium trichocladiopsis]KAH7037808.1 hypothetical protein B0I36DRAFT_428365 [Microdochium trichocladiopsis]